MMGFVAEGKIDSSGVADNSKKLSSDIYLAASLICLSRAVPLVRS